MAAMLLLFCILLCHVTQVALFLFPQKNNFNITYGSEGVNIVRQSQGDIAFLFDTSIIGYYKNLKKPCNLMEIGAFGGTFIGWILQKNSRLKEAIDLAVSKLQDSGEIKRIRSKWFRGECGRVTTSGADHAAAAAFEAVILGLLLSVAMLC